MVDGFRRRLISLSLEQQCFRRPADEEIAGNTTTMSSFNAAPPSAVAKSNNNRCSPQPLNETYNLVEEVYVNRDQCHTELQVLDESPEDGIVVAVDIGTTYTGYAYSFRRSGRICIMKKPDCKYTKNTHNTNYYYYNITISLGNYKLQLLEPWFYKLNIYPRSAG